MSGSTSLRVDPRALLRARAGRPAAATDWRRTTLIGGLAFIGLAAFGAVVVRANDDAGVLAFIKQQTRPAPFARQGQFAPPQAQAAQRSFYPSFWPRRRQDEPRTAAAAGRQVGGRQPLGLQNSIGLANSYAPFDSAPLRPPAEVRPERRIAAAAPHTPLRRAAPSQIEKGGLVTYCVRSCDGYFFPLGPSTGSEAGDAAACRSLCPASETRLYTRRIGEDMDQSRSRKDGRRYTALATAFQHRNVYDAACSCTGNGPGLATNIPASRDPTLRVGDAVMTPAGMKVFNGARGRDREASFTPVRRTQLLDSGTRETLRRLEQASLPGRSGVQPQPLAAKRETPTQQARFVAVAAFEDATSPFRYVGPNGVKLR